MTNWAIIWPEIEISGRKMASGQILQYFFRPKNFWQNAGNFGPPATSEVKIWLKNCDFGHFEKWQNGSKYGRKQKFLAGIWPPARFYNIFSGQKFFNKTPGIWSFRTLQKSNIWEKFFYFLRFYSKTAVNPFRNEK